MKYLGIQDWWSTMSATYSQIVQENKVLYTRNFSVSLRLFQNLKKKIRWEKGATHSAHKKEKNKTRPGPF